MDSIVATIVGDIALVSVISALLGSAARRLGQPTVIGQILTGILLGPSLLGRLPGHLTAHLFPHQVLPYLTALSQVAVVIFMFAVGYEIELRSLRRYGKAVPLLAAAALVVPMGLGMACVLLFRPEFRAIGVNHQGQPFLLFMGVATSVTALPVLAAIVRERGLAGSAPGVIATAAAGIMDVLVWLVLAAALIEAGRPGRLSWLVTLLLLSCFVAFMLGVMRPAVSWWTKRRQFVLSNPVPVAFALAMGSAWFSTWLGLHPVFGAFLAGLAMRGANRAPDADVLRSMDQVGNLLLPLFFVVTGLSLSVGTVRGDAFVLLALIIAITCAGKLGPGYAACRACGFSARDSATIAALVNTRGLTELIALNVGLVNGLINQRLFTVLVLMGFITTLTTGPLLSVIRPASAPQPTADEYAV